MHTTIPLYAACEQPVFIVAPPRSGARVLRSALARHPSLAALDLAEALLPAIDALAAGWQKAGGYGHYHALSARGVQDTEYWRYAGLGLNALYTSRAGSRTWLDTAPDHARYLDELARLFPGARFIALYRDGREVVRSLRQAWGRTHRQACELWRDDTSRLLNFRTLHPARIHSLAFEALSDNPQQALEPLYRFLRIDAHAAPAVQLGQELEREREGAARGRPLPLPSWNWLHQQWFDRTCGALQLQLGYSRS